MSMRVQDVTRRVQRLPRKALLGVALPVAWLALGSTFVALKVGARWGPHLSDQEYRLAPAVAREEV